MPPRRLLRASYPTQPIIDAVLAAPVAYRHADKKYVTNLNVCLPVIPSVDLETIGYSHNGSKVAQLERNYFSPEEFERVSALLRSRRSEGFTSVTMSLRGQPKSKKDAQGWCMESLTIVRTRGRTNAYVFYRQAEVAYKLAADFPFLRSLLERLEVHPSAVHLLFAAAYLRRACNFARFAHSLP